MNHANAPLVQLENLAVTFLTPRGAFRAVRSASLEIARGEVLGLVGESGCGKSTVAFAMMDYLPDTAQVRRSGSFRGHGHIRNSPAPSCANCAATASPWSIRTPSHRSTRPCEWAHR